MVPDGNNDLKLKKCPLLVGTGGWMYFNMHIRHIAINLLRVANIRPKNAFLKQLG